MISGVKRVSRLLKLFLIIFIFYLPSGISYGETIECRVDEHGYLSQRLDPKIGEIFIPADTALLLYCKEHLIQRNGIFFKRFSDKPFSGRVNGFVQGELKAGKMVGVVRTFYSNGQLHSKYKPFGTLYKGPKMTYYRDGSLASIRNLCLKKRFIKRGLQVWDGEIGVYKKDGSLDEEYESGIWDCNKGKWGALIKSCKEFPSMKICQPRR